MIPFWKKTDKGGKKKPQKPAVPRTAQQSIPMQRMFEDGTCRVKPNYYTRTIQYQDINYQLAQQEDKTAIFEEWCSFLNFFDSSIKFELSFVNMATDSTEFEKSIRINILSMFIRTGSKYTICFSDLYGFVHCMLIIKQGLLPWLDN